MKKYVKIKKKINDINKGGFLFMCKACELGKIVVNMCLDKQWEIDTAKLQKLLVLMHGLYLAKTKEPLFPENVLIWDCGVAIKEVDKQFREFGGGFCERMPAQLATIRTEQEVIDKVLERYGDKDVFEINEDIRLKKLKDDYYDPTTSVSIDNDEIRKVFEKYADL